MTPIQAPADRWRVARAFLRNPTAVAGSVFLLLVGVLALLAPLIYPGDPLDMVATPLQWPGQDRTYFLGTDSMGRDLLAGVVHGARISLVVGLSASLLGVGIGIAVGAVGGYFGGRTDRLLLRLIELFQTVPNFILLVVIVVILQPTLPTIILGIGLVTWPTIARLVRSEFRALRGRDFVMAARSLGYGHARIIFREILPNALPPVIVTASAMVASAILMESALSFMGLGDPNSVSWGSMIGSGRELLLSAWYLTAVPGTAIALTVLAVNLGGDGINDAFNPGLMQERPA